MGKFTAVFLNDEQKADSNISQRIRAMLAALVYSMATQKDLPKKIKMDKENNAAEYASVMTEMVKEKTLKDMCPYLYTYGSTEQLDKALTVCAYCFINEFSFPHLFDLLRSVQPIYFNVFKLGLGYKKYREQLLNRLKIVYCQLPWIPIYYQMAIIDYMDKHGLAGASIPYAILGMDEEEEEIFHEEMSSAVCEIGAINASDVIERASLNEIDRSDKRVDRSMRILSNIFRMFQGETLTKMAVNSDLPSHIFMIATIADRIGIEKYRILQGKVPKKDEKFIDEIVKSLIYLRYWKDKSLLVTFDSEGNASHEYDSNIALEALGRGTVNESELDAVQHYVLSLKFIVSALYIFAKELEKTKGEARKFYEANLEKYANTLTGANKEKTDDKYTILNDKIRVLNTELSRKDAEIERLKAALEIAEKKTATPVQEVNIVINNVNVDESNRINLAKGDEPELYDGEIANIIIDILQKYAKEHSNETRRVDLINSIVSANESIADNCNRIKTGIKTSLTGVSRLDDALRRKLEGLGLEIIGGKTHYKLRFHGDSRYQITMAKTGSDRRGSENLVATINKKFL